MHRSASSTAGRTSRATRWRSRPGPWSCCAVPSEPMPDRGGHLPADGRPVPTSTYRLQLSAALTFADTAAVVPYLAELSVSHLYCSPYLAAAPGSTHGYDVVDHSRLDPELGGEPGHARLVATCRAAGLGLVLDLVPNHMAVGAPQSRNP